MSHPMLDRSFKRRGSSKIGLSAMTTHLKRYVTLICTAILCVGVISVPSSSYCESPDPLLQRQLQTLQREVRTLRDQQRDLRAERDQLTQTLKHREILLLMRDFHPRIIRAMSELSSSVTSSKARSPLPKKRTKVRYMERATDRAHKRDLRGLLQRGPTLIALWATWCKPCVSPQEQAHLRTLKRRLQRYGVPLISIGVDQWSKVKRDKDRWFYPLWHVQDAHLNMTPEVIFREVGMGLPLFFLRLPDGSAPYFLAQTLSEESVDEWVTLAVRAKLGYSFE